MQASPQHSTYTGPPLCCGEAAGTELHVRRCRHAARLRCLHSMPPQCQRNLQCQGVEHAGQGTIGAEILKQLGQKVEDLDAIVVPIGGGGLIAGIAAYVKALKPQVKIIGVEPAGANCMAQSLQEGRRITLSKVDAFADGVAVKSVGAVHTPPGRAPICTSSWRLAPAALANLAS